MQVCNLHRMGNITIESPQLACASEDLPTVSLSKDNKLLMVTKLGTDITSLPLKNLTYSEAIDLFQNLIFTFQIFNTFTCHTTTCAGISCRTPS